MEDKKSCKGQDMVFQVLGIEMYRKDKRQFLRTKFTSLIFVCLMSVEVY